MTGSSDNISTGLSSIKLGKEELLLNAENVINSLNILNNTFEEYYAFHFSDGTNCDIIISYNAYREWFNYFGIKLIKTIRQKKLYKLPLKDKREEEKFCEKYQLNSGVLREILKNISDIKLGLIKLNVYTKNELNEENLVFSFLNEKTRVPCDRYENMKKICKRFCAKIDKNYKGLFFIHDKAKVNKKYNSKLRICFSSLMPKKPMIADFMYLIFASCVIFISSKAKDRYIGYKVGDHNYILKYSFSGYDICEINIICGMLSKQIEVDRGDIQVNNYNEGVYKKIENLLKKIDLKPLIMSYGII